MIKLQIENYRRKKKWRRIENDLMAHLKFPIGNEYGGLRDTNTNHVLIVTSEAALPSYTEITFNLLSIC